MCHGEKGEKERETEGRGRVLLSKTIESTLHDATAEKQRGSEVNVKALKLTDVHANRL